MGLLKSLGKIILALVAIGLILAGVWLLSTISNALSLCSSNYSVGAQSQSFIQACQHLDNYEVIGIALGLFGFILLIATFLIKNDSSGSLANNDAASEELRIRYARGEVSEDEYNKMSKQLIPKKVGTWKIIVAAIVVLFLILLVIGSSSNSSPPSTNSTTSTVSQSATATQKTLPKASYDEQAVISFTDTFTSLAYNVTAIAQSDQNGYGPAYLVQGLTPNGFWYQVGLVYNWTLPNETAYTSGFTFIYEVFAPNGSAVSGQIINGKPIYGAVRKSLYGQVYSGDKVLLNLYFLTNGTVRFYIKDWNTSAAQVAYFSSEGSSEFVGTGGTNSNGFFTGLMTEWYHATPNYIGNKEIIYTPYGNEQSGGRLIIDGKLNNSIIFGDNSSIVPYSEPSQLSSHNISISYNNGVFTTGS